MAVTVLKNPSSLRVRFDCGKDDDGKAIRKTKTYSNLRHDALEQDVYDVGSKLASLSEFSVMEIAKIDNSTIAE